MRPAISMSLVDALTHLHHRRGFPDKVGHSQDWPADIHVIGKGHYASIGLLAAFLMSSGLPVPKRIYSHGFLNVRARMSKSTGMGRSVRMAEPTASIKRIFPRSGVRAGWGATA